MQLRPRPCSLHEAGPFHCLLPVQTRISLIQWRSMKCLRLEATLLESTQPMASHCLFALHCTTTLFRGFSRNFEPSFPLNNHEKTMWVIFGGELNCLWFAPQNPLTGILHMALQSDANTP